MKRHILALVLALSILLSLCPTALADNGAVYSYTPQSVVYIPLDDRPLNDAQVRQMAESLGLTLVMPDSSLYATVLDGASGGSRSGDRAALLEWLMSAEDQYDYFILSLDQLLSGGLMNSRCMEFCEDIVLSDGTVMTEYDVIDYLASLSRKKTVYFIDSVMRLATCYEYGGYTMAHYEAARAYGQIRRTILQGSALTVSNIISNYRHDAYGNHAQYSSSLTQAQRDLLLSPLDLGAGSSAEQDLFLNVYLRVRERKLLLTTYAIEALADENCRFLLGVDDSASGNNIQTNEISYFTRLLGDRSQVSSSLDSLGKVALCRLFQDISGAPSPTVTATYFGGGEDVIPSFNYETVTKMVDKALSYLDCQPVSSGGDIALLVLTPMRADREVTYAKLVRQINENIADGIPTILINLDEKNTAFEKALLENTQPGMLLAYSGYASSVNTVHLGLSLGMARYCFLHTSMAGDLTCDTAHLTMLGTLFADEFGYSSSVHATESTVRSLGLSCEDFNGATDSQRSAIRTTVESSMASSTALALSALERGGIITDLSPYTVRQVDAVTYTGGYFPWNRTFEYHAETSVALGDLQTEAPSFHRAYLDGNGDDTFQPDGFITRAQAAKMLVGITETPLDSANTFPDVSGWAEPYIASAAARRYIRGYEDGTFRPDSTCTRAEFAQMLRQYMTAEGLTLSASTSRSFPDVTADAWYYQAVTDMAGAGIINGYEDGTFRPDTTITRAEAVTMLGRVFQRDGELLQSLLDIPRFTDISASDWFYSAIQEASISHFR